MNQLSTDDNKRFTKVSPKSFVLRSG